MSPKPISKLTPKQALEKAVELAGGQEELAQRLTKIMRRDADRPITQQHVWNWLNRDNELRGEYVLPISEAVDGQITPGQLRPDLYPPELFNRAEA